jgi:hypothetical protein
MQNAKCMEKTDVKCLENNHHLKMIGVNLILRVIRSII